MHFIKSIKLPKWVFVFGLCALCWSQHCISMTTQEYFDLLEQGKEEEADAKLARSEELDAMSDFGKRSDGTPKGRGWLGPMDMTDGSGQVMTENTVGVNIDGKETEIPTLVPTLSKEDINYLLAGNAPSEEIVGKAVEHARGRLEKGLSPFYEDSGVRDLTPRELPPLTGASAVEQPKERPGFFQRPKKTLTHEQKTTYKSGLYGSENQEKLLQQAQDQGVGFLFGLVLGVVFLLLVRPRGKSKSPKEVAFRLMAWGLILVIAMETSRFWVKGDFVAFIDAILRTSINAGLLWVIGYGFGWVKFYLIRRKNDGPSGAALTREEFSVANSSANQGDPQAQYQLALCYFHGQGVVKNTIEAYKWVLLAQANGIPEARGLCSQIEKKLSNEEILKGQARASEFVSEQAPELGTNEIT